MTADRAGNPDNDYGWGIIDALAAMDYWGPSVDHTPLEDVEDETGPYTVSAQINDRVALDPANLDLFWRVDGGSWNTVPLSWQGGITYGADIPGQSGGGLVEYYLRVGDVDGYVLNFPLKAPDVNYSFTVGPDAIAPVLVHAGATDQTLATWPPTLVAVATDNLGIDRVELEYTLNGGAVQGPFTMSPLGGDEYSLEFPLDVGGISVGDEFQYTITAWDTAGVPNSAAVGPFLMLVVDNLGLVLVIDDTAIGLQKDQNRSNVTDMVQWLTDAGYSVDTVAASDVGPGAFVGYDALVLITGGNPSPLDHEAVREGMIAWAQDHGRILVEGGSVTEVALGFWGNPLYPEFAQYVLHAAEFWGDPYLTWTIRQAAGQTDHPFLNRPYLLPEEMVVEGFGYNLAAVDYVYATSDALPIMRTLVNVNTGGVIIHDDNTAPEAGQTVYFTWDMTYMDPGVGRQVTENAMAYLMAHEAPGTGSISGVVNFSRGRSPGRGAGQLEHRGQRRYRSGWKLYPDRAARHLLPPDRLPRRVRARRADGGAGRGPGTDGCGLHPAGSDPGAGNGCARDHHSRQQFRGDHQRHHDHRRGQSL